MTTTWPLEMSRIILDYAGYIQTTAQIARDKEIERRARWKMPAVIRQVERMGKQSERHDDDYGDDEEPEIEKMRCVEPSFVVYAMACDWNDSMNGPLNGYYVRPSPEQRFEQISEIIRVHDAEQIRFFRELSFS